MKKGTGLDIPADIFAEGFVVHKPPELLREIGAEFLAVVMGAIIFERLVVSLAFVDIKPYAVVVAFAGYRRRIRFFFGRFFTGGDVRIKFGRNRRRRCRVLVDRYRTIIDSALIIILLILRADNLCVFLFHSSDGVFECCYLLGLLRDEFVFLAELGSEIGDVDEEILLGKAFFGSLEEALIEGHSFFKILTALLEDEVSAVSCPEAVGAFEHGSEDDDSEGGELLVLTDGTICEGIVFPLVSGA